MWLALLIQLSFHSSGRNHMLSTETGGLSASVLLDLIIWWAMSTRVHSSVKTGGGSASVLATSGNSESQSSVQVSNSSTSSCLTWGQCLAFLILSFLSYNMKK